MTTERPDPRLVAAIQTNCHIADARQAADLPLCIYLLQMRELYRWEQGLPFGAALDRAAVGAWLAGREALWAELEHQPYVALPIGDRLCDPLDAERLNAELAPLGWAYGAGLEATNRQAFFLARLEQQRTRGDGVRLQVCGAEQARGLFAPPAALVGGHTIVLRRESLARWLWEKFEAFNLRRAEGPFKALADAYGLHDNDAFVAALPRLVDDLSETLVLHELGEHRAGQSLGAGWGAMRLALRQRRTDLHVRAVRDHMADLEVTLPTLLDRGAETALHFWFANYDGVREQLFPSLPAAYAAWRGGDAGHALRRAAQAGALHFRGLAGRVLRLHERLGGDAESAIERLLTAPEAVFTPTP